MRNRTLVWIVTSLVVVAASVVWRRVERTSTTRSVTVFSAKWLGLPIVIPRDAIESERRAAQMLRSTLAKSSGRPESSFPIETEQASGPRRAIFVGATQRAGDFLANGAKAPFDMQVGARVRGESVLIRSERRESIESAASWFLETRLGARWFMPGPLGEIVPRRGALSLAEGTETVRPGFISRHLGLAAREARNGMRAAGSKHASITVITW